MRRPLLALTLFATATSAAAGPLVKHSDLPYAQVEGVDPNLLALDVYTAEGAAERPVVVFVHGGGWAIGDKDNRATRAKAEHFVSKGFVFASVNYRLTPAVQHPVHVQDVARSLAWIQRKIATYGGDPQRVFLIGHSAGAHLAALVALDPRYLAAEGVDPVTLQGVVLLDGAGYDISRRLDDGAFRVGDRERTMFADAFSDDPAAWREASPVTHVSAGAPPLLLFHAGQRKVSRVLSRELAAAVRGAGTPAKAVAAPDRDHASMNRKIGVGDDPYTGVIDAFLADPLAVEQLEAPPPVTEPGAVISALFDRADADGDGRVSRDEFEAKSRRPERFDRLDRNADGFVTPDELVR